MSVAKSPSDDDAVYAEVAVKKFSMDENVCYEVTKPRSTNYKNPDISVVHDSSIKKVLLLLFVLLIALLLGTVCACIAFALEISKLKSGTASLQQSQSALNIETENLTLQMRMEYQKLSLNYSESNEHSLDALNLVYQQLDQNSIALQENIQALNSSIDLQLSHQVLEFNQALDNRTTQLVQLIFNALERPGTYQFHPVDSCADLPPSSPSGYYWVRATNGSSVLVYCHMTRSCGGVTGGWVRVAELDMTNSSHQCPSSFIQLNDSNRRTCGPSVSGGCSSVTFSTAGLRYSKVCGKIKAYQVGSTNSFGGDSSGQTIDDFYVDGISLTHGNPRQHIWTFASALDEVSRSSNCPCINTNSTSSASQPPAFVGDYFCDTGSEEGYISGHFYGDDPLWDGAGCGPLNTCCSFNNPPWFYKQLSESTPDGIEMRVCRSELEENIALEIVDIYIQ